MTKRSCRVRNPNSDGGGAAEKISKAREIENVSLCPKFASSKRSAGGDQCRDFPEKFVSLPCPKRTITR